MITRALVLFATLLSSGLAKAQAVTELEVRADIDRMVFETLSTSKDFASWRTGLKNFESLQKTRAADFAALDKYREEVVAPLLSRENKLFQSYNARRDALLKAGPITAADSASMALDFAVIEGVQKERAEAMREFSKRNVAFNKKYSGATNPLVKAQNYFTEAMKKRPSQESPRPGYKAVFTKVWTDVFSSADKYAALIRRAVLADPAPAVNPVPATRAPAISPEANRDEAPEATPAKPSIWDSSAAGHSSSPYVQEYK